MYFRLFLIFLFDFMSNLIEPHTMSFSKSDRFS
nr:hypothetical protein pmam_358 [Pithovirus mammoth]